MAIYALGDIEPVIHPEAFIHPDATIIGAVFIGARSSVWPSAVLRGDNGEIHVGEETSVQDGAVIHTIPVTGTRIGSRCVIGHLVHLEGCTIEDDALVGNGSIVLHNAIVRRYSLVGSGAVVPNNMEVPSGAMALGIPAKLKLDAVQPSQITMGAQVYVANAARYRRELRRID
jgi:carbonic anhydrase/acetyltransferase-like protein (isoleucine patch superfamily)